MSNNKEKHFIVVSPSHHKKPRTMFLNKTNSEKIIWCDFVPGITTLWLLSEAQAFAANSPVAIWFIEDKDWISSLETGDMPKFADILKYAQKAGSQILQHCNYGVPPIFAPSEQELADDALRDIAARLHDFTAICITSDKSIATLPDGERDEDSDYLYLLYTLTAGNQITYYRSENPRQTIRRKKQVAEVFTKVEAQAKTTFADEDGCMWFVEKVNRSASKDDDEDMGEKEAGKRTSEIKETAVEGSVITTLTTTDESGKSDSTTSVKPVRGAMFGLNQFSMPTEPDDTKVITLPKGELVEMLDNLPENRPLYKDSGSWQIRTDDMEEVLYEQGANESFFDFIKRAYGKENFFKK